MYETDSFFETIAAKMYGEVNNFSVSPWSIISNESEASFRTMHYEFPQAWAFSKVRNYSGKPMNDAIAMVPHLCRHMPNPRIVGTGLVIFV